MFNNSINKIKVFLYGVIPYIITKILEPSSDKLEYYKFFIRHGYTRYPYAFAKEYLNKPIQILYDQEKQLPYVIHKESKKLYFPREYSMEKIEKNYKALSIEQDRRHPHHYINSAKELSGKTLLDIGAAEGFTSLDTIEHTRFVYLFEYEDKWIEALKATFEPWKEKVQIIKKFIGNQNSDLYGTIDQLVPKEAFNNAFLKMDIEGNECNALAGCIRLFTDSANLNFAICTYHKKEDEQNISKFLDQFGCHYSFSDGYIFVKHSFRKCIIKGSKRFESIKS